MLKPAFQISRADSTRFHGVLNHPAKHKVCSNVRRMPTKQVDIRVRACCGPRIWLARLTIPLEGLSKQIDRLLEEYCFQILATNSEAHNGKVSQTATHLTWILAEYLSDTITWLMRSILNSESKILFDKDTQLLLTLKFWLLLLHWKFLNSARTSNRVPLPKGLVAARGWSDNM